MEEEIKLLWEVIRLKREDWDRYLILADAYEDMGDQSRSEFYRAVSQKEQTPYKVTNGFAWYDYDSRTPKEDRQHPQSDLPRHLFKALKAGQLYEMRPRKEYPSVRDAFEDLYQAWLKCGRSLTY